MTMFRRLISAAFCFAALGAASASAVELVVGGYAAQFEEPRPAAADPAMAGLEGGDLAGAMVVSFTPRGAALPGGEPDERAPTLRLELAAGGSDTLISSDDTGPSWLDEPGAAKLGDLSIGGALQWSEWSVGGGLARTALFGGDTGLVSATVGYGSLTASLGYGQSERSDLPPLDVLMLSTDLGAWSWLTLESDMAVGSDGEAEQMAVGRLGVRLNF